MAAIFDVLIDGVLKIFFPEDKFPDGNDAWNATQDTALACEKINSCCVAYVGGGFQTGGSSDVRYHGSNFAAKNDVVLVTINYRRNAFGFLNIASIDSSFEDSGYLGIKDQIAALQWGAAFAATGNPNNEFIPHWEKYSAKNRQTMELNSKKCVCHKDLNTDNLNSLRYVYES